MEVSGQLHAPAALPPGEEASVPTQQEAGWSPEPVWTQWRTGKFSFPATKAAKIWRKSGQFLDQYSVNIKNRA